MKIDIYILSLLKFRDDKIVFEDDDLKDIKEKIYDKLKKSDILLNKEQQAAGFIIYSLKIDKFKETFLSDKVRKCLENGLNINSLKIGFYHHRVIVYFQLDLKKEEYDFLKLRDMRDKLKESADKMIYNFVIKGINEFIYRSIYNETVKESRGIGKGEVEFYYTYPFIIVKKGAKDVENELQKDERFPFSEQISSLCFEIVELSRYKLFFTKHIMRISIPGAILYTGEEKVDRNLMRNIINAIYQYCLYEKKLMDDKKGVFENRLDEKILVKLWEYLQSTMGGRNTDLLARQLAYNCYLIAFLALLFSIISFFR